MGSDYDPLVLLDQKLRRSDLSKELTANQLITKILCADIVIFSFKEGICYERLVIVDYLGKGGNDENDEISRFRRHIHPQP